MVVLAAIFITPILWMYVTAFKTLSESRTYR
jgi:ABC-type glycerol-3-phosphate transport system permease component